MKVISTTANASGAYPPIQEGGFSVPPAGAAIWPDSLNTAEFYAYNGFVTLTVEAVETVTGWRAVEIPPEEEGGEPTVELQDVTAALPTVTACVPNVQAWEAWKASLPEEAETEEEPSAQDDTDAMLVDHEYRITLLELGVNE